jgi:phosphate transport system substrate-binding protein
MSTSEDDSVLVNGVAGDKNALGFFGAAYFFQNRDKLTAVSIVNPETNQAVAPMDSTIEDGSYAPFSRPLFIYVNTESMNKAQVEKFVGYYLQHAAEFARQVGYVPLPTALYERVEVHFLDRLKGTHYLDDKMEKRSGSLSDVYQAQNLTK